MRKVAIITARGGSKRIPKKNIKEFFGKPIISYSIKAALESGLFDEVMVSTDSEEIADVARSFGASVPFLRSEENSSDFAGTEDVLGEVLKTYEKQGRAFDYFCCIYPTAPFVTPEKLKDSFAMLDASQCDGVLSVTAFSFPPQRGFVLGDNKVSPVDVEAFNMRSQDLEAIYHDCGQFYWSRVSSFKRCSQLITDSTLGYVVSEMETQDIDNTSDWEMAELKYSYMRSKDE
ncbi:pseudaminic acid cytidylyltransferase [Paraeggerthella hongkongensis]|nr:pseudaminic acid cytidylyltransferase [Paraeggerthella hongkongensis]